MSFIKFKDVGRKSSSFVSITNSQSFGFGADFLQQHNLLDKNYIELFYDSEEQKIAFYFKDTPEKGSTFKLIGQEGGSRSIVARSFFTKFLRDFKPEQYESRYKPEKVEDVSHGTLYVIQLKQKQAETPEN